MSCWARGIRYIGMGNFLQGCCEIRHKPVGMDKEVKIPRARPQVSQHQVSFSREDGRFQCCLSLHSSAEPLLGGCSFNGLLAIVYGLLVILLYSVQDLRKGAWQNLSS